MNAPMLMPWHNTPRCTAKFYSIGPGQPSAMDGECGGPMIPVREMANGYGGEPGSRIACAACGEGVVGTGAEVAQAERAARAQRLLDAGLCHPDRACEGCGGALLFERFRRCAECVDKDNAARQGSLFPGAAP